MSPRRLTGAQVVVEHLVRQGVRFAAGQLAGRAEEQHR